MMDQYSIWTVLKKYYKRNKGKKIAKLPTYQQLMEEETKKWEAIHNQPKEDEPFKGDLKEMAIVTVPSPYLMLRDVDRYQILTIDKQGNVFFKRALPRESWSIKQKYIDSKFTISEKDAAKILNCVGEYFKKPHDCLIIPDCGYWEIILENTDCEKYESINITSVAYTLKELGDNANEQLIKEVKLSEELHEMNFLIKSIIKNKSIIAFGE